MDVLIFNCCPVQDGATAYIARAVHSFLEPEHNVTDICIGDYNIAFCNGCRSCHKTTRCIQDDDMLKIISEYECSDVIVHVSPSYWADVPGQFKAFIDRCTPWSNTHEPHASIGCGKKSYAVALRTGPGMKECERIVQTLEHFCGHLEIQSCGSLCLCGVENRQAAEHRIEELKDFCGKILTELRQ